MAKLYFRYGSMGSGKTIDLLKVAYNYKERGQNVLLLTSALDDRYGKCKITTRIGIEEAAIAVSKEDNVFDLVSNTGSKVDAVLVDEVQFFSKSQIDQLSDVVDFLGIPVICYGLRCDFRNNFFEGSARLMEIADKIEEIKTICKCGKKATCNLRTIDGKPSISGDQIFIGGNESYVALCRKCYKEMLK